MIRDHLEKIRYFNAICEAGTFRQASENLRVSQSSLTVAVHKLEEDIGALLLTRSKKGVKVTAAGRTLLSFAKDLAFRVDDLEARLRAPDDPFAGRVRIGAYDSIAIYWLPEIIHKLRKGFPNLDVSISIGSSHGLAEQLKAEQIDFAIVVEPPDEPRLQTTKLFSDVFSFFATPRMAKAVQPGHHFPMPIIAMAGARAAKQKVLGDLLREQGISLKGLVEVESFEIAKALAAQEIGIAVIPHRVAKFDQRQNRLVPVKSMPRSFGRHKIALLELKRSEVQSQIRKSVVSAIIQHAQSDSIRQRS